MEVTEDSIAVVGVGGRFPGASDVDQFWRLLLNKENHVKDIPPERWNNEAFYDPNPDAPGKSYVKKAGLLDNHDVFDNRIFGINDLEAERMDPQQHYVLECTHMALENAGITRDMIKGSKTGVYMGSMNHDFRVAGQLVYLSSNNYSVTGASNSILAARVSYVYDLRGPSMVVDTACSSALVALHLGAQAITTGECDMAICGGVSSLLLPDFFIVLSRARMLSATGQSQAFSQTADGYARGEGCGVVILKRLGQAVRDGDHIWGVVGTLCNQDGRSVTPITAPSGAQQVNLLRDVYSKFKVNPRDVTYIEAHGTGTPVGDPVEVSALGQFFGSKDRPPLPIGSVKTNIGHLESAAGMAGLIKVLLMIKHQKYVPTVLFSELNPQIDFAGYGFHVCTDVTEWKVSPGHARIACINSFGFGGTNSHAIVEEYVANSAEKQSLAAEPLHPSQAKSSTGARSNSQTASTSRPSSAQRTESLQRKHLVVFSAPTKDTLINTVEDVFKTLEERTPQVDIKDLSYTTTQRRDLYAFRLAVFASDTEELLKMKDQLAEKARRAVDATRSKHRLIFLFCGVGTAWKGMCKSLMQTSRVFRSTVDQIDKLLKSWDDAFSIKELLEAEGDISDPLHAHLAIFTSQVALLELWKKFEVLPDAIVGQSVGEVAAAYCSGILKLEDAVKVIYHRSKSLREASGGKMMVIANCPVEEVEAQCTALNHKASIAVYSSPKACTVSGDADALDELKSKLLEEAKDHQRSKAIFHDLDVHCAYHSHHVEKAAKELQENLDRLQGSKPVIPIVSTVTGKLAEGEDFATAQYWQRNTRDPVQLHKAMAAAEQSCRKGDNIPVVVVEVGPRPVLRAHLKDIFPDPLVTSLPSVLPDKEEETFTKAATELFQMGVKVKITECHEHSGKLIDIPRYPINRTKVLFHPKTTQDFLEGKTIGSAKNSGHPFISRNLHDSSEFIFNISPTSTPFVYDHVVSGTTVVQGATFGEVGLAVGQMIWNLPTHLLEVQLSYDRVITLKPEESVDATVSTYTRDTDNTIDFTIRTKAATHARGTVKKSSSKSSASPPYLPALRSRCPSQMDEDAIYEELKKRIKITFRKTTRILKTAWFNDTETLVEISFAPEIQDQLWKTALHPTLLDAVAQATVVLPTQIPETGFQFWLPAGISKLAVHRQPEPEMLVYLKSGMHTATKRHYSGFLLTRSGELVAEVIDLRMESKTSKARDTSQNTEYEIVWTEIFPEMTPFRQSRAQDFLLLGPDATSIALCQDALRDQHVLSYTSVDKLIEDLRNFPKERLHKIKAIVLCSARKVDLQKPQQASDASRTICWMLISLIQYLSKMGLDIRVYIVTYNCQALEQTRFLNIPFDPTGSVLWGVVRSANVDFAYDRLHLVDLTEGSSSELQLLRAFFCEETSPSLDTLSEIKLHNKRSFVCEFVARDQEQDVPDKMIVNSTALSLQVLTTNASQTSHFVCRILDPTSSIAAKGMMTIHVQRAFFFDEYVQPRSPATTQWFPQPENGLSEMKVFEALGTVTQTGDQDCDVRVGDSVVALYPMTVATEVAVPAKSVMKVASPQTYRMGSALHTYLLSILGKRLHGQKHVVILHSEDTVQLANILLDLLRQQELQAECIEVSRKDPLPNRAEELVLLLQCDTEILLGALSQNSDLKHVVAPRHLMSSPLRSFLRCSYPDVSVSLVDFQEELYPSKLLNAASDIRPLFEACESYTAKAMPAERPDQREHTSQLQHANVLDVEAVARAATHVLPAAPDKVLLKSGAYLVTGGHSGLGWETAKMLADGGAGMVVCLSRSKPSEDLKREMKEVSAHCRCHMISMQCDVSELSSVQTLMENLESLMKGKFTLRGVFHCAGVFDDTIVIKMTEEKLANVFRPKVLGTLNLHHCTKDTPLDFFVVSSSISGIIGNNGQAGYCAANCFEDAMMFLRRQEGLAGQTINWGALNLGIVVKDEHVRDMLAKQGWMCLEVEDIRDSFFQTLGRSRVQSIYCKMDKEKLLKALQARMRLSHQALKFKTLMAELVLSDLNIAKFSGKPLLIMLPGDASEGQKRLAVDAVKIAMSELFMLDEEVPMETKFLDLGVDSMLVVGFINRISEMTGTRIPIGMLFDEDTTVGHVVNYLKEKEAEEGFSSTDLPTTSESDGSVAMVPEEVKKEKSLKAILPNGDHGKEQNHALPPPPRTPVVSQVPSRDGHAAKGKRRARAKSQNPSAASSTSLVKPGQVNVSRHRRKNSAKNAKVCEIL